MTNTYSQKLKVFGSILSIAAFSVFFLASSASKKAKTSKPVVQMTEVAPKNVDVAVEVTREVYEPIGENVKPNPIKLVPFVNVEDLLDLKGGMTQQEVASKLGGKAFDIISSQLDGYTLVSYKYKKVHIILDDQTENKIGAKGPKEYGSKIEDAYLVFNRDGKLELVISKEAYQNAAQDRPSGVAADLLKAHRNLYAPARNDGKLMIKL